MDCAAAGTLRQCRPTDHHWTGPVQPVLFALQGIPSRGRKADPIPGRIFQHYQSPQLRPAQHEYFFVAYDSRRHCGSDYRNGDDGAADTIGPEAHLLSLRECPSITEFCRGWVYIMPLVSGEITMVRL